ncbi:MAG: TrmB family transcriptional regulator [Candidatus Bathyarchaeia archaeon]
MESEPTEVQTLTDLGLTLVQARVYLALVRYGTSKIASLSKASDVARPDVYRTLNKLYELGLVEKIVENPVQFKALTIEEGIKFLLLKKQAEYERLKSETDALLSSFKKRKMLQSETANQFVLIPQKEAIVNRIRQAIDNSQKSVSVVISWKRFVHGVGNIFLESAQKAAERKINYRFIVEKAPSKEVNEAGNRLWNIYPTFQARFLSQMPKTVFGLYDDKELFVVVDPKMDISASPALWTNNAGLVGLAHDYFEMLWQTAAERISNEKEQ